jgi:hypothetical protein
MKLSSGKLQFWEEKVLWWCRNIFFHADFLHSFMPETSSRLEEGLIFFKFFVLSCKVAVVVV